MLMETKVWVENSIKLGNIEDKDYIIKIYLNFQKLLFPFI